MGRYSEITTSVKTININPSVAVRLTDRLSVGAGANLQYVRAKLLQAIDFGTICVSQVGAATCAGTFGLAPQANDGTGFVSGEDFGYGFNLGEVDLSVGFTGYYYTGDFDDTYQELNFGAGFGLLTLAVAIGEYANFDGPTQNYTFYSLMLEKNGFYGKFGGFAQDFEGEYFEAGYGTTIAEVDLVLSVIISNEKLVGADDEAIVFTLSKSFDL